MRRHSSAALAAVAAALLLSGCATAAAGPTKPTPSAAAAAARNGASKSIADLTKKSVRHEGLFTVFQDTANGTVHLLVKPDQLGREFIYWSYTVDGVVDAWHFRGAFGDNKVFTVEKQFDRVAFVQQPTHLYFDPENPLARAADANVSTAVMATAKIAATDTASGEILIEADGLFQSEAFRMVKYPTPPGARPGQFFTLGRLDKDKTLVTGIRSYPLNTDVVVDYVYHNDSPYNGGGEGVIDPRNVTIRVQHTLIAMPENGYHPRFEDPRVGYFTDRQTDMTSPAAAPYRDLITRWNLVKKEPGAALSEPVEPITWWIENTTPLELRETIREAALLWNEAFETAGFRNAVVVEVQPDDADWDAGDIRYNVLRWTSSPNPPFGGYGPSFTNPRTGQILGADIMLEYVAITNRLRNEKIFDVAALPALNEEPASYGPSYDAHRCDFVEYLHQSMMFGQAALMAQAAPAVEMKEFTRQYLHRLILHEIGHTLGLNHNMMASFAWTQADLQKRGGGVSGSVMEYPGVNVAAAGQAQGDYYDWRPGPYDHWAIEFGYSEPLEDEAAEEARLEAILARSTEKALAFGNDADDMRTSIWGIDPRVNIYDLSDDPIGWAVGRVQLAGDLLGSLREKFHEPGGDYHALRNAYLILTGEQATALSRVTRFVGGVYRDRAMQGQPGATKPFTPVSRAEQKRAMSVLARHAFAPDAWQAPDDLLDHLMMRRRGFEFFGVPEDPKVHARVLAMQSGVLSHLLHPNTLQRMTDSRLYGGAYPVAEMMTELTDAVFAADARRNVNTFRQNLQLEYVNGLVEVYGSKRHDHVARSAALHNLQRIQGMLRGKAGVNLETRAHTQHVLHAIEKALEADE